MECPALWIPIVKRRRLVSLVYKDTSLRLNTTIFNSQRPDSTLPLNPQSKRLIERRLKVGLVKIHTLTEFIRAPVKHIKIISSAKITLNVETSSKHEKYTKHWD